MPTQKAIQIQGPGDAKLVSDAPYPVLKDTHFIVKTKAVALNPTDWKFIDAQATKGAIVGCDYAGVVVEVGKDVPNGLKKGDRVAGWTFGGNPNNHEDGAFREYILAKGGIQLKIPENVSFEDACTLGVAITTVGQSLYEYLKLPFPDSPAKESIPIVIYGASSAMGTLAVQWAKLSGFEVIALCSPHNFPLVKSFGAAYLFNYRSPTVSSDIRALTRSTLTHVFDPIATPESAAICAAAIGSKGGHYHSLAPVENFPRTDVVQTTSSAYATFGEDWSWMGYPIPGKKEDFAFGVELFRLAEKLLGEGKIKVHPPVIKEGGLEGILEGIQELKEGKVSGGKLVYRVE